MSLHHALKAVDDLLTAVDQLAANVLPGTARPYRTPTLTTEQREQRDHDARLERQERVNIAPGDSPDPYRFEVVELLTDILVTADNLWEEVAGHLGLEHQPASSHMADPSPYLRQVKTWLHAVQDEHPETVKEVQQQALKLTRKADAALGLLWDGERLPKPCPCCQGPLVIRVLPLLDSDNQQVLDRAEPVTRPFAVCESGVCTADESMVGRWHRGAPAWDVYTEGEWLATWIRNVERARTCRCGTSLRLAPVGRPAEYCSSECKQAARRERDSERMAS